MGFIRHYILPKEVDFNAVLQAQVNVTHRVVDPLYKVCIENDAAALADLDADARQAGRLKTEHMEELLDVFITPYDKESIYRFISQLDWVVLSVKHFKLETHAYSISNLQCYRDIMHLLVQMSAQLAAGVGQLASGQLKAITRKTDSVHDQYDQVVTLCAEQAAALLQQDDCKRIIVYKDILNQLREIAKRIHVTANTLEDMAIKVV